MLFPVQWSDVIENADEPVRLIANFPDFVKAELASLNPRVTLEPPSTAPKSYDVMVGPPRDRDHSSDRDAAFPCPTAGATSTTMPATAAATNSHRARFIRFFSATHLDDAPRRARRQARRRLTRERG